MEKQTGEREKKRGSKNGMNWRKEEEMGKRKSER